MLCTGRIISFASDHIICSFVAYRAAKLLVFSGRIHHGDVSAVEHMRVVVSLGYESVETSSVDTSI